MVNEVIESFRQTGVPFSEAHFGWLTSLRLAGWLEDTAVDLFGLDLSDTHATGRKPSEEEIQEFLRKVVAEHRALGFEQLILKMTLVIVKAWVHVHVFNSDPKIERERLNKAVTAALGEHYSMGLLKIVLDSLVANLDTS